MRGLIALTIVAVLLGAGGRTQAGPPINGAGPHDEPIHALAVSDAEQRWSERVVVPLLERLRPVGRYEPVNLSTDEIVDLITDQPASLGLMRRSSLPPEAVERGEITFIEVGPAACLVLAVAPEAPWMSYADLNYVASARGLRVTGATPEDLEAFRRVRQHFPLRPELAEPVQQPLRLAVEQLLDRAFDVLAFEVARPGASSVPPSTLVDVMQRGVRLLEMPTRLYAASPDQRLPIGKVPLSAPALLQEGTTYTTFCDAFVMVFALAFADDLFAVLDDAPEAAPAGPAAGGGFVTRVGEAAGSFVAMLQRWL
jgi:hypothetical protein